MIELSRRRFFSLLPAPLIVAAANIMPVKALLAEPVYDFGVDFAGRCTGHVRVMAEFVDLSTGLPRTVTRIFVTDGISGHQEDLTPRYIAEKGIRYVHADVDMPGAPRYFAKQGIDNAHVGFRQRREPHQLHMGDSATFIFNPPPFREEKQIG